MLFAGVNVILTGDFHQLLPPALADIPRCLQDSNCEKKPDDVLEIMGINFFGVAQCKA